MTQWWRTWKRLISCPMGRGCGNKVCSASGRFGPRGDLDFVYSFLMGLWRRLRQTFVRGGQEVMDISWNTRTSEKIKEWWWFVWLVCLYLFYCFCQDSCQTQEQVAQVVESPPLEIFRTCVDMALSNLGAKRWLKWPLEVSSNLNYDSVIICPVTWPY